MLKRVDRFYAVKVILKPLHAAVRFAVLQVFEKIRNLVLPHRSIAHRIAFKQRHLNLVQPGEQKHVPLFFTSFFDGEPEVRVFGADQLRQLFESRELIVFRQNPRVISHSVSPSVRPAHS